MAKWTNEDGLIVRFDTSNSDTRAGGREAHGVERIAYKMTDATKLQVNSTDPLTAASTAYFWDEMSPGIPAGAYIVNAYLQVDAAFTSSGSAVLDVGLMEADGSIVDVDALDDGIAVAALGANAVVNMNGAGVNGVVKTSATLETFPCFSYETAAFTAGACTVVIEYVVFP
jgi:hypothetical protein